MGSIAPANTSPCLSYKIAFSKISTKLILKKVGFHDQRTSHRCSIKAMSQFNEARKLMSYVDNFRMRLWEVFPEPVKEIPWEKAENMLLKRLLFLGEKALKWSLLASFVVSSFSDVVFSISRNRELLIPLGLFVGCMMVDFLKETSQDLFQTTEANGDLKWHLFGIGCFFVLLKVVAAYFSLGGRILLSHVGNGGLMQVLWSWKKLQEKFGSNKTETSSSLKESSSTAT